MIKIQKVEATKKILNAVVFSAALLAPTFADASGSYSFGIGDGPGGGGKTCYKQKTRRCGQSVQVGIAPTPVGVGGTVTFNFGTGTEYWCKIRTQGTSSCTSINCNGTSNTLTSTNCQ